MAWAAAAATERCIHRSARKQRTGCVLIGAGRTADTRQPAAPQRARRRGDESGALEGAKLQWTLTSPGIRCHLAHPPPLSIPPARYNTGVRVTIQEACEHGSAYCRRTSTRACKRNVPSSNASRRRRCGNLRPCRPCRHSHPPHTPSPSLPCMHTRLCRHTADMSASLPA